MDSAARRAGNRLHHLSMRYVGALVEVVTGGRVGFLAASHPGIREMRDLIDLILLMRAEINGLTKLLLTRTEVNQAELENAFREEYDWLAEQKAKFLGVEVSDAGLVFRGRAEADPEKPS